MCCLPFFFQSPTASFVFCQCQLIYKRKSVDVDVNDNPSVLVDCALRPPWPLHSLFVKAMVNGDFPLGYLCRWQMLFSFHCTVYLYSCSIRAWEMSKDVFCFWSGSLFVYFFQFKVFMCASVDAMIFYLFLVFQWQWEEVLQNHRFNSIFTHFKIVVRHQWKKFDMFDRLAQSCVLLHLNICPFGCFCVCQTDSQSVRLPASLSPSSSNHHFLWWSVVFVVTSVRSRNLLHSLTFLAPFWPFTSLSKGRSINCLESELAVIEWTYGDSKR